jgi:hypothetical protein
VTLLCVIPGPTEVLRTEPDERPTRWCFTCRKHQPHTAVLLGDPLPPQWVQDALLDDGLDGYTVSELVWWFSPYDPSWSLRCPLGHSDHYFPGCGPL